MHLASRLVQNDHAPRRGRPFHPFDKRYRGGGVPRVGVHFLNDRPRSVEELDTELHYRTLAVTTPTVARTFAAPHISSRYRASTAAMGGKQTFASAESIVHRARRVGNTCG